MLAEPLAKHFAQICCRRLKWSRIQPESIDCFNVCNSSGGSKMTKVTKHALFCLFDRLNHNIYLYFC